MAKKLEGELFTECASWVWEQLQEDGFFLAGELVELILTTERELGVQHMDVPAIAVRVADEFRMRGITGNPYPIEASMVEEVLHWEDQFLGLAGIRRDES